MPLNDNISFLYSLEKFGIKLGLDNTFKLLTSFKNPQNKFKSIHIAGTNGKGSTSAFISSILMESGYSIGHYTSPHLVRFNERIKVNNVEITDEELSYYVNFLKDDILNLRATFFEVTTSIAFKFFSDKSVDFAVLETGLGGRYDSTNVINPLVSVITNISMDHVQQLGNTIESITYEKAGIIKPAVPLITAIDKTESIKIIERIVKENNTKFFNVNDIFYFYDVNILPEGLFFKVKNNTKYDIYSPLNGIHQIKNILCAIQTVNILKDIGFNKITDNSIVMGIKNVVKNTGLRCRIETYSRKPYIILDVAHNVDSIKSLIDTIKVFNKENVYLIFGIMKDKDYPNIIKLLSDFAYEVYCVKPNTNRALASSDIYKLFRDSGSRAIDCGNVKNAIDKTLNILKDKGIILITGSHYVCGEALEYLNEKCLDKI